jgi:acyl dehydratase
MDCVVMELLADQLSKFYVKKIVKKLKRFNVRFSSPVFPGETIVTEIWKKDDSVHFQSRVKERDKIVLKNGICEIL